ncbi:MAG: hypothetical protein ABI602_04585 [Candidatus Saccharibacteria bacterium]
MDRVATGSAVRLGSRLEVWRAANREESRRPEVELPSQASQLGEVALNATPAQEPQDSARL